MSYKLALEEISNGWVVTGPQGKTYREDLPNALQELRVGVDLVAGEAKKAEKAKEA